MLYYVYTYMYIHIYIYIYIYIYISYTVYSILCVVCHMLYTILHYTVYYSMLD